MGMNEGLGNMEIVDNDSLEIMSRELEELENDELSVGEAGFLQGYENNESYELYA